MTHAEIEETIRKAQEILEGGGEELRMELLKVIDAAARRSLERRLVCPN